MKVILVNPPVASGGYQSSRASIPPTGIGYLAAYLEQAGISCEIIDGKLEGLSLGQVIERIITAGPDMVGLSAMTPDIVAAAAIARETKAKLPETTVVVGGAHAIAMPRETLEEFPEIDYVVAGEGEDTLLELVRSIQGAGRLEDIQGLAFRNGNGITLTPPRDYIRNLDALPFPAWSKFRNRSRTYAVISARGCPYRCSFCMRAMGKIVRERSPEHVVDEVEWLVREYGARNIVFHDETFTLKKERTLRIADLLVSKGLHKRIKWVAQTRADRSDEEVFARMKAAGCERVEIGVESGNQEILNRVDKGTQLPQIEKAVACARKAGLHVACTFILGHPYETEETIQDTIDFAVRLKPDSLSIGIMCPYPGTKIWDMARSGEGNYRLLSSDWQGFVRFGGDSLELTNLPRRRLEWLQVKAYAEFYLKTFQLVKLLKHVLGRWRQSKALFRKLLS